jgi:hypothetical protein
MNILDSRFRGNDTIRNLSFPRKRESRLDYYPINLQIFIRGNPFIISEPVIGLEIVQNMTGRKNS